MKNLTLSFWLALAAASIIVVQNATPLSSQVRTDLPIPTCPPDCADQESEGADPSPGRRQSSLPGLFGTTTLVIPRGV